MSEPHFHPISALPAIRAQVRGWLDEVEDAERLFGEAGPFRLDDATITHALQVCGDAKDDLLLFEEQLRRWLKGPLTADQRASLDEITTQLGRIRNAVEFVVGTTEALRGQTIDEIL